MNTEYFQSTIVQLNSIAVFLNQYKVYMESSLATQNLSCAELAAISEQAAAKILVATNQSTHLVTKANADISALQSSITAQIALLAPLLVAPTDLSSVITFCTAIGNLYIGPNAAYITQQATLTTQLAAIAAASASVASSIATISTAINTAVSNSQSSLGCI
jgi:hypothetical protein